MDATQQKEIEVKDNSTPPVVNKKKPESESGGLGGEVIGTTFDIQSFTRTDKILENLKHITTLQDVFDSVMNGMRAPNIKREDFTPYTMLYSKRGIPILGPQGLYKDLTHHGVTFQHTGHFENWTYMFSKANGWLVPCDERLQIKWDPTVANSFLTKAAVYGQNQIEQGVRNTRAIARYVLGDFQSLITTDVDTVHRSIRTDAVASWMYDSGIASGLIAARHTKVINASDLIAYLNTHVNTFPVPVDTLCLNLRANAGDEEKLGKISIFKKEYIVDFNDSVDFPTNWTDDLLNYGTIGGPENGLRYKKIYWTACNPCDTDVWEWLANTYDPEELSLALFLSALWLPGGVTTDETKPEDDPDTPEQEGDGWVDPAYDVDLEIYTFRNSIQDQVLNFFYGGGRTTSVYNQIDPQSDDLSSMIWSYRIAKTCLMQKAAMMDGAYSYKTPEYLDGQKVPEQELFNDISGIIDVQLGEEYHDRWGPLYALPAWIPFEFWVANGARLDLDNYDDVVTSMSGVAVNRTCKIPRSQVYIVSKEGWDYVAGQNDNSYDYTLLGATDYYMPNARGTVGSWPACGISSSLPSTLPYHASYTKTMSVDYVYLDSIEYRVTKAGKNRSFYTRRSLGF